MSATTTINGTYSTSVTLTTPYTTITGTGKVTNNSGNAIYGNSAQSYTVTNSGFVNGYPDGIYLKGAPGTIINTAGGLISGGQAGIMLYAGGSVTNQSGGTISGNDGIMASNGAATVVNAGNIGGAYTLTNNGVYLSDGGSVTNQATGNIYGRNDGVLITGASGTVINLGRIHTNSGYGAQGVYLAQGGVIVNGGPGGTVSAAYIAGYSGGIIFGATGTDTDTVVNYGTVSGDSGAVAVSLLTGTVINGASGATGALIESGGASNAVLISGTGTVANYGTVAGVTFNGETNISYGVSVGGSGTVASSISNLGSRALIYGYVAVYAAQNATVTNSGTLEATQRYGGTPPLDAVIFGGGTNRLIIDPGAVFIGNVYGSGPVTLTPGGNTIIIGTANGIGVTTMELASAASAGTLSGLGTKYVGFAAVAVDAGASWTLASANTIASGVTLTNAGTLFDAGTLINAGNVAGNGKIVIRPGATMIDTGTVAATETIAFAGTSGVLDLTPTGFSGVIGNFQTGDVISLTGVNNVVSGSVINGNTIDLVRSNSSHIDLTLSQPITNFTTTVSGSNTLIKTHAVTCFVAGTSLATPDGPVAVEALCIGDMVLNASGHARPVRWIGRRHLDLTRHPKPRTVQPIRILAGALGDGLPNRDLLVSPDHAMLLDGMLVPARLLRNDVTIRREGNWTSVTYYHVELETHDVLLAEGAEAESYLDTGNRDTFENAGQPMTLHPDLSSGQRRREAQSCAPFAADAERVEPVWRRLAGRAPLLGRTLPEPIETTTDPDLRIECGGRSIGPFSIKGSRHTFLLPAWRGALRLRSRYAVPGDAKPWIEDQRQLGVMVRTMTITDGNDILTITVDNPALQAGWWSVEQDGCSMWRWTDGSGIVAVESATPCRLEIDVAETIDYDVAAVAASTIRYPSDFLRRTAA